MKKSIHGLLYFLAVVLLFTNCRKKAFDEFYGRPDNLQPPMYQVLQQRGNFTNLLTAIDKAGYKDILSKAGYWTFFAPNDEAFSKYFAAKGTSLAQLTAEEARKIVTYSLAYNAFDTTHLADYQGPQGWVPNQAFKRKTAYYDGFYTNAAQDSVFISLNRNTGTYAFGDENNKYIPFFHFNFMGAKNLGASDYTYFFPGSTYTNFNVGKASVVEENIVAENGVIHEISEVVEPLPSIEQKLASSNDYSTFKNLFDRFMVRYIKNDAATHRYSVLTGKSTPVYAKIYSPLLAYAPGNESFVRNFEHDSQTDGYTMVAPTNASLDTYLNDVILEFFGTIDKAPESVVADLINAHMWQTIVWPSRFNTTQNFLGERLTLNSAYTSNGGNITESQFLSNGAFYGTNKVHEANVFKTVYARAYLDPEYSIMTRLINQNGRIPLISPGLKYTLFMLPDSKLRALGFDYSLTNSNFTQTVDGTTVIGGTATSNLLRILNLNMLPFQQKDLSGQGIAETNQGEYIRWENNKIFSGGTIEKNYTLTIDPSKSRDYVNGTVHFVSSSNATGNAILDYPTAKVASAIQLNAGTSASPRPYFDFYEYMRLSSAAYDNAAQEIVGLQLGANYTVLIPTREAMKKAVENNLLPGTKDALGKWASFTYNPTTQDDKDKVQRFINYHIIKEISIVPDGLKGPLGTDFPTMLRNQTGDVVPVTVVNQPNNLQIIDTKGRTAKVLAPTSIASGYYPATSNHLGNRAVYHLIDNYLEYTY